VGGTELGACAHPGGQSGLASAVVWGSSGERLISGGGDGTLRWWEVQSGECVREPCLGDRYRETHQGTVQALKVSPDGSRLASCGDDGTIRLWDLQSGEPPHTLRRDLPYERLTITGIRGLTEAQKASLQALGGRGGRQSCSLVEILSLSNRLGPLRSPTGVDQQHCRS